MIDLLDPTNSILLESQGYFTTKFIGSEEVDCLQKIYQENYRNEDSPFYSTSFSEDIDLQKKVNKEVIAVLQPIIDQYFTNYKLLGSSYLEKLPHENNPLPIHQDWTVCDEALYGSFTIWIPLQETTINNGAIRVIPGSHITTNNLRAPSLPVAFENSRNELQKYLRDLPLKAGEAFIFNQALMHASYPNQSNQSRLAVTVGLVPEKAKMSMLYYDNDRKKVSRYSMPDDMFLHYPQIIKSPKIGAFEEEFDYVVPEINEQILKDHLYQNRIKFATMKPLFNDAKNQELFEKNGFLKIPAINEEDIQALLDLLEELNFNRANGHGFYVGMDHQDKKAVSYMMDRVAEIVLPKVAPYLVDYRLITASFVIKDPNPVGIVPPHQDWTFVEDEVQHCSVTCWIPLQKTTMENGCLGVIKGSNQYFSSVRPSPSPQSPSPLSKHMFTLFPYLNLIEMEAGEALIFDNRTIHASPPNISNEPRLAVGLSFTQKEAELRHYYLKPGTKDTLIKYKIDPAFFKKYDNASLSKMYDANQCIDDYEVISEQPFLWDDLSKKQFEERMLASGNQYNKELANHMKKLFGQQMKTGIINKVKSLVRKVIPI